MEEDYQTKKLQRLRLPFRGASAFLSVLFFVPALIVPDTARCMEFKNLNVDTVLVLEGEYNDNVNLSDGKTEGVEEDFLLHIMPSINLGMSHLEHNFSLVFSADYREGFSTEHSETNYNIQGQIDLNFPSGLNLRVFDTYNRSRFDEGLDSEAGISNTQSNTWGVSTSYSLVERLRPEAKYEHRWLEFEEDTHLGQSLVEKVVDTIEGQLSFPVYRSVSGTVSGFFEQQDSDERKESNHRTRSYLAGLRWQGPYRFTVSAAAGREDIDFEQRDQKDYDNTIYSITLGIRFTEAIDGELTYGTDGYDNSTYDGRLNYAYSEETSARLFATKSTQVSFSSSSAGSAYENLRTGINFTTRFLERVTTALDVSYQTRKSFDDNDVDDKIWIGKISLQYPLREWLKAGAYYQYATRDSIRVNNDYDNNRVGMNITLEL